MSHSDVPSDLISMAHWLASQSIEIAPAFGVDPDGFCGCRNRNCRWTGKHPMLQEDRRAGSCDPTQIALWWRRRPTGNLLIHTGRRSKLVVIDVDVRDEGLARFEDLTDRAPELLSSLVVRTGSGGLHLYFRSTDLWPSGLDLVAPGIDLRGEDGFVIGPYSRHSSGKSYAIEQVGHGDTPILQLPPAVAVLLAEVTNAKSKS